ncbi:MAG: hypothetical protein WC440_00480 [Candidatus Omnitrophota bacterium]
MYSHEGSCNLDIARIEEDARAYLLRNDRFKYLPVLASIERVASARGMIVGGRIGVVALSHDAQVDTIDADLWMLELFSPNIHDDMIECMKIVTREMGENDAYIGNARTIMVVPIIHEREYHLIADFRIVAVGRSLGTRVGVDVTKLVVDASKEGRGLFNELEMMMTREREHGSTTMRASTIMAQSMALILRDRSDDARVVIRVMPRTLQIMRLAHMLCNPDLASKWSSYIGQIGDLFDGIDAEIGIEHEGARHEQHRDMTAITALRARYGAITIGERAVIHYISGHNSVHSAQMPKRAREQYIMTFDNVDELCASEHLTYARIDVRVPDDFRARKVILRHGDDIVADVFNTVDYEPVPVVIDDKGEQYASPLCVIRFLFIDIWSLDAIIEGMSSRENSTGACEALRTRQRYLGALARKLFDWMICAQDDERLAIIFPRTFEGFAVPESSAKGRANKGMRLIAESAQTVETLRTLREELAKKIMS